MANNTINQLPLALTIDPIADLLPIFTSSTTATQAISRNTYLGITGSPIGTTDVQSLSNKTLVNTNTITVKDSLMTLQNTADLTKQARFSLASITTGNIRTYTLPDISDTIVTLGATQTLTAKTLTSPTITSPTITSPLINSILDVNGNSWIAQTATASAVNQVTVANATTGNSPTISATGADNNINLTLTPKGTGTLVATTAAVVGLGGAWQSYTPTFTGLPVGSSTVVAKYIQVGKVVHYRLVVTLAGGNVPTGSVSFTLPVTSVVYPGTATLPVIGNTQYFIGNGFIGYVVWSNTTTGNFVVFNAASTYLNAVSLSATIPATFVNGSELHAEGYYEAA